MPVKGLYFMYGRFHATIQYLWLSENGFWDKMLSMDWNRTFYVFVDVNVDTKHHSFNIPLFLDKYNIMIVMQKIKSMQEFTFAINVECLQSSLHAQLLMHNCARAKHTKTCSCSI